MSKTLKIGLIVSGGVILIGAILATGIFIANASWGGFGQGMMSRLNPQNTTLTPAPGAGTGVPFGQGMMNGYNDQGMMNGYNGQGMMGSFGSSPTTTTPLTMAQAKQAVESYLTGLNNADLELKEILIFDNNAYARITEKSTGIGAMELLVDPATQTVYPEHGPNMMWNLKYSPMGTMMNGTNGMMGGSEAGMMGGSGAGMMGGSEAGMMGGSGAGMMGGSGAGMMGGNAGGALGKNGTNFANPSQVTTEMPVSAEQAVKIAQQYLDQQFPGYQADTAPDPFYGYYTIDILKDGKPTGMLSVNGYSQQVFLHTWHGTFIEASE